MALLAYVTTAEPSLTVIDVTNPRSPVGVGVVDVTPDLIDVLIPHAGKLYGTSLTTDALVCLSTMPPGVNNRISGAGAPNFLNGVWQVAQHGKYCYVACQMDDGVTIIDISNPNILTYAGGIYGAGIPNYLSDQRAIGIVNATHVCVAGWSGADRAFNVIDVSNPAAPVIVGQVRSLVYSATSMAVSGTRAYLVDNGQDLTIVDVSDVTNPTLISSTSLFVNGAHRIKIVGSYAYVVSWSNGLYIVNISNPAAPFVTGNINGAGPPNYLDLSWGLHVMNNIAYVTGFDDNSLVCIDVSNPTLPTLLGVRRGAGAPNYLFGAFGVWVGGLPTVVTRPATGVR